MFLAFESILYSPLFLWRSAYSALRLLKIASAKNCGISGRKGCLSICDVKIHRKAPLHVEHLLRVTKNRVDFYFFSESKCSRDIRELNSHVTISEPVLIPLSRS